jgi:hypothetical protein
MFHYLYKTTHKDGRYYVGRHSTKKLNDNYIGSGKWVKSIKDKNTLSTEILCFFDSVEKLKIHEKLLINEHINNEKCMNFNNESCGFASNKLNPSHREDIKYKSSIRFLENNPMKNGHTEDTKKKISLSVTGKNNPFFGKTHSKKTKLKISEKTLGRMFDIDAKQKMSKSAKRSYELGREPTKFWSGKKHSQETISKMSNSAKNRKRIVCNHCGQTTAVNTFSRWHGDKCKMKL